MHAVIAPVVVPIVVVTPVVTPIVVVTWTVPSWTVVVVVVPVVIVDVDIGIAVVPIRSVVVVPPISPIAVAVPIIVAVTPIVVAVPVVVTVAPIVVAIEVIVAVPIWTVPTSAIGPVAAIWSIRVDDAGQRGNSPWTISATNARPCRLGRRAIQSGNIVWTIVDPARPCDPAGPCNAAGTVATLVRAITSPDIVSAKTRSGFGRWLPTV